MQEKKPGQFIFTTVFGGLIFLVPVVTLALVIAKAMGFMMVVAQPMADWLPIDTISGVVLANVLAILALIVACFLAGLLARHALASVLMAKLETKILLKLPGYMMIKNLVSGFDASEAEGLKPVAIQSGSVERIGFEVEKLQDGRSSVFIPSAPNPFSGITQVLPPEQVTYLNVSAKMIMEASENFGHGMGAVLAARKSA